VKRSLSNGSAFGLRFFGYFGDIDYGVRRASGGIQAGLRQGRLAVP